MKAKGLLRVASFVALTLFFATVRHANGQTLTGQISGSVLDPDGAAVAGANVELTNELTKQVRGFKTESNGTFLFPELVPGNYDLNISQPEIGRAHV